MDHRVKPGGQRREAPCPRSTFRKIRVGFAALSPPYACYFGNSAQFWLDLQSQYDIAVVEREHGVEITRRVRPANAA